MSNYLFDVLTFLEHYQQYPCLWNQACPDYKNRRKRDDAEMALLKVSKLENVRALKAKVRSIRGTYNNEIRRMKKSKATSSCADDVYKPKLRWFQYAHSFLYKNQEEEPYSETTNLVSNE